MLVLERLVYILFVFVGLFSSPVYALDSCESIFSFSFKKSDQQIRDVMDVARSESARVYAFEPASIQDLRQIIEFARYHQLSISLKGTNHTHGGHNRLRQNSSGHPNGIQIDMLKMNQIVELNQLDRSLKVQAGATWAQIAEYLNQFGFAIKTEQSSNIFSVGGSLSANIHGRDIYGPIIRSVKSLTLMDARGQLHVLSPKENHELMRAVIGGYGAFGIIVDVTLSIDKNYVYQAKTFKEMSVEKYVHEVSSLSHKPNQLMHYARLNLSGKNPLSLVTAVEWIPLANQAISEDWSGWRYKKSEPNLKISTQIMNLMRNPKSMFLGWQVKDLLDEQFGLPMNGDWKTKNNIQNNPVHFLFDHFYNKKNSVDILQEYFIEPERLAELIDLIRTVRDDFHLNLMNVTIRYIPRVRPSENSILSPYSETSDQLAVVLYFNVQESKSNQNGDLVQYDGRVWTEKLINGVIKLNGSFYLPYHQWWTDRQFGLVYGNGLKTFKKLKKKYDPDNVFSSDFTQRLMSMKEI